MHRAWCWFVVWLWGYASVASAQTVTIDTALLLETATVVGRRNETIRTLPYYIETIADSARARAQSLTTADALATLSGVYVQKSQLGGGSPVVRGFEANRVLLVVDGVRMNNAIYRSGHLQNAITVDANALERIELIYGAGALAYGSDALGGVVHFRTKSPEVGATPTTLLATNLSSAARAANLSALTTYGGRQWAGLSQASVTRFGNLRAGGWRPVTYGDFGLRKEYLAGDSTTHNPNPRRLVGSGYAQYNLLQKFRLRLAESRALTANLQFSTTGDVPRYDALTERRDGSLRWARWDYGPQTRLLGSLRLDERRATGAYDLFSALLSYQFVEEDRLRRRRGSPVTEEDLVDVHATQLQVDLSKALGPATILRYGFGLRWDRVVATAMPADNATRYPSRGSGLLGGGAYLDLTRKLGREWLLRGGLRYGYQELHARFGMDDPVEWPRAYVAGIDNPSAALTGALGLRGHGWRLLWAQGFRAPNLNDFAVFREQSGRVQVPNPGLTPERSNTFELGYTRPRGRLRWSLNGYLTLLNDAIIRRAGELPDGRDRFVSRGDTLFVDTNVNAERAWIVGADAGASWTPSANWTLETDLHWLRGRRRQLTPDDNVLTLPQDHIPPTYGRLGLRYRQSSWDIEARLRAQLRKKVDDYAVNDIRGTAATGYVLNRIGTPDNLDLTPNEMGTPGWWTLDVYLNYTLDPRWTLRFKAENVFDRFYQPFASGIPSPGIDIGLGVTYRAGGSEPDT